MLTAEKVQKHYASPDLGGLVLSALAQAGKDIYNLLPSDLAPVDEFHIRGRKATIELAHAVGLEADMTVLDVGSGIGGASRYIAAEFGCQVTGLDLTEDYCRVAEMLTNMVGLSHLVNFQCGDALHMPFSDNCFDVVWTQHTAMNIQNKANLYREISRVLRPGGVLAIYDILAGAVGPIYFPVPWSYGPETSFLVTPDKLRLLLKSSGFTIVTWRDTTDVALNWFRNIMGTTIDKVVRPLGLNVLMGDDFQLKSHNQLLNLEENRVVVIQATAVK